MPTERTLPAEAQERSQVFGGNVLAHSRDSIARGPFWAATSPHPHDGRRK